MEVHGRASERVGTCAQWRVDQQCGHSRFRGIVWPPALHALFGRRIRRAGTLYAMCAVAARGTCDARRPSREGEPERRRESTIGSDRHTPGAP
eukprot:7387031-Prymnesium_polylepis.1